MLYDSVPGWSSLIKSIVPSGLKFLLLIFLIWRVAPVHRRIQIEHFVWFGPFRTSHLTHPHYNLSATFEHRIQRFVHQNRDGSVGLMRIRWRCFLFKQSSNEKMNMNIINVQLYFILYVCICIETNEVL